MIIDCIADLHGYEPQLPGGDILIVAGDMTACDLVPQWMKFFVWLGCQDYKKKLLIAGNHDNFFETGFSKDDRQFEYLCDSPALSIEGLKIWGTPWTPWFKGVNPICTAFMDSERYLSKRFDLIPNDLDILITHGPMSQVLDIGRDGSSCGSLSLKDAIDRAKPRYHVFGHIHGCAGRRQVYKHSDCETICINCSYLDDDYEPVNQYQRMEI